MTLLDEGFPLEGHRSSRNNSLPASRERSESFATPLGVIAWMVTPRRGSQGLQSADRFSESLTLEKKGICGKCLSALTRRRSYINLEVPKERVGVRTDFPHMLIRPESLVNNAGSGNISAKEIHDFDMNLQLHPGYKVGNS